MFVKLPCTIISLFISFVFATLTENINGELLSTPTISVSPWNSTWTDQLKRKLLMGYDKFARPHQHFNTTDLSIKLTVRHIDIDEIKSIMTVYGWLKMGWKDDKLKWDPLDYGNLDVLHLADHEIWQPDIVLYNSASGSNIDHYGNTNCLIQHDGSVIWIPPTQFHSFCELNMRYWPFDTQVCNIVLGSWTHDGNQINLTYDDSGSNTSPLIDNNEWEILSITTDRNRKFYDCCAEPYLDIQFNFTIKRQSPMYREIVVTPAVIVVFMTLSSFWLPSQTGEKIILNAFTALIICLLLIYFAQQLPTMAAEPLVVLFYTKSLYLVCFSIVISIIVLNISKRKSSRRLPPLIKMVLDRGWESYLFIDMNDIKSSSQQISEELRDAHFEDTADDRQIIASSYSPCPEQNHWTILAQIIDRITFLVYTFIFIIISIVYSV